MNRLLVFISMAFFIAGCNQDTQATIGHAVDASFRAL